MHFVPRLRTTIAIATFIAALACPARADLAPPGPDSLDCPDGAIGTAGPRVAETVGPFRRARRTRSYCAPTTCTSDADCTNARVCSRAPIGLCVRTLEVSEDGTVQEAPGACEPDETCSDWQSTCEQARRCVWSDPAPPPSSSIVAPPTTTAPPAPTRAGSCDCRASAGSSPRELTWLALLALWRMRRRRRNVG